MNNFTTRKTSLFPPYTIGVKEEEKLFKFLSFLDDSSVASLFPKRNIDESIKGGRPPYSYYDMLATALYSFAFGSGTLRSIETSCKYDLRYMYLMNYGTPNYSKFCQFINEVIVPNRKEIFKLITNQIIKECDLTIDDVFIDGSKFEADANKYKFVWKPVKHHEKLSDKIKILLNDIGISRSIPSTGIIDSKLVEKDITLKKKYELLCEYLTKSLEYEEKERICGPNRNSYYKTDYDATAMCLKEDYYSGLGSNMHAGYNTQLLVSKGIMCSYYISQSRSDINDFIPVLK